MNTKEWFNVCKPSPTPEQACVQIGVHLEEVAEMLTALKEHDEATTINRLANTYKTNSHHANWSIKNSNKAELLDSIIDQAVTIQGVCHTLGMDYKGALEEVERSNASKLVDGKPIFDKNGKIAKGGSYSPPNLKPYT